MDYLIFFSCTVVYFIPSIIAYKKNTVNSVDVYVVNLLLGWTILGWIASLFMGVLGKTLVSNEIKNGENNSHLSNESTMRQEKPEVARVYLIIVAQSINIILGSIIVIIVNESLLDFVVMFVGGFFCLLIQVPLFVVLINKQLDVIELLKESNAPVNWKLQYVPWVIFVVGVGANMLLIG